MKLGFSRRVFWGEKKKRSLYNFIMIRPMGAKLFHADGRTWKKLTDAFRRSKNPPKIFRGIVNCGSSMLYVCCLWWHNVSPKIIVNASRFSVTLHIKPRKWRRIGHIHWRQGEHLKRAMWTDSQGCRRRPNQTWKQWWRVETHWIKLKRVTATRSRWICLAMTMLHKLLLVADL